MLARKVSKFISLARKPYEASIESPSTEKKGPSYPSLYLSDSDGIDLPITDADVNKEFTVEVTIKPRRVTTSKTNGKVTKSFDIDVTGIRFLS